MPTKGTNMHPHQIPTRDEATADECLTFLAWLADKHRSVGDFLPDAPMLTLHTLVVFKPHAPTGQAKRPTRR